MKCLHWASKHDDLACGCWHKIDLKVSVSQWHWFVGSHSHASSNYRTLLDQVTSDLWCLHICNVYNFVDMLPSSSPLPSWQRSSVCSSYGMLVGIIYKFMYYIYFLFILISFHLVIHNRKIHHTVYLFHNFKFFFFAKQHILLEFLYTSMIFFILLF